MRLEKWLKKYIETENILVRKYYPNKNTKKGVYQHLGTQLMKEQDILKNMKNEREEERNFIKIGIIQIGYGFYYYFVGH